MALLEATGLKKAFGGLTSCPGFPTSGSTTARSSGLSVQTAQARRRLQPGDRHLSGDRRQHPLRRRQAELTGRPSHAITALGVARTFQNQRLFNQMTVLENVLVGRHCRTRAGLAGILACPRARAEKARLRSSEARESARPLRRAAAAAAGPTGLLAVLRQPPAPGDRPGARHRAAPAAARRAGRRHEPDARRAS